MRSAKRYSLAAILSGVAHASLLVGGTCSLGFNMPEIDFELEFEEVEFIDIDAEQQDEPVEPPPMVDGPALPPGGVDELTPDEEAPGPEDAEPEKKFGDKTAKVDKLAPASSTFYMFMANRRIRKLDYAEDFLEAFSPQYDFRFLVDGGGFHPWNDFEYMMIASSNIADPTQNFIAVSHDLSETDLKTGIERASRNFNLDIEWVTREGKVMANPRPSDPEKEDKDPRWFVLVDDHTAIYIRDEFLDAVIHGEDGDGKTARNFVANVSKMRRYAKAEPKAGFTLVFKDIRSALKSAKMPFPVPNDFEFMFEAAKAPELVIKMSWPTTEEARTFETYFNEDLKAMIDGDIKLKIVAGAFYKAFSTSRNDKEVVIRGALSEGQAKSAAELMAGLARKATETSDAEWQKSKEMRERSFAEREEAAAAAEESGATGTKAPEAPIQGGGAPKEPEPLPGVEDVPSRAAPPSDATPGAGAPPTPPT